MNVYKEILNAIEYHKNLYDIADTSVEYYDEILHGNAPKDISGQSIDGMPHGSKNFASVADTIDELQKWLHMRELEESTMKRLEGQKRVIDTCINSMDDITVKVQQLRAMGLTQEQVGEVLNRTDRQIRNIEKKLKCNM